MKNYQKSLRTNRSPEEVFRIITNEMNDWWSTTSNKFTAVGDRAKVTFPGMKTFWTFEARELNPHNRIVLECVEAHHVHKGESEKILKEWLGTILIFEIDVNDNKTVVKFTHEGLTPDLLCHGICKEGWDHFVGESLKEYLNS